MNEEMAEGLGALELRAIADIVRQESGIVIAENRMEFVRVRLAKRLAGLGYRNISSYLRHLRGIEGAQERRHLVDAMTTNTTGFFREPAHFRWMESTALPLMSKEGLGRSDPITVWSAACSIGAELWSAAMVMDQFNRASGAHLRFELFGTDISQIILRRAAAAVFTEDEITGLSEEMRQTYLLRSNKPIAGSTVWPLFRIAPELRSRGQFQRANLLDANTAPRITADIVFLRNVLIYFSAEDQKKVIHTVLSRLRPGGYLLTGHTEGAGQGVPGLTRLSTSIYQKD